MTTQPTPASPVPPTPAVSHKQALGAYGEALAARHLTATGFHSRGGTRRLRQRRGVRGQRAAVVLHAGQRGAMQVAGARVVAEARPVRQHGVEHRPAFGAERRTDGVSEIPGRDEFEHEDSEGLRTRKRASAPFIV